MRNYCHCEEGGRPTKQSSIKGVEWISRASGYVIQSTNLLRNHRHCEASVVSRVHTRQQ